MPLVLVSTHYHLAGQASLPWPIRIKSKIWFFDHFCSPPLVRCLDEYWRWKWRKWKCRKKIQCKHQKKKTICNFWENQFLKSRHIFPFEAVLKYFCRSTRFLSDVTNKANYVSENLAQQGAGPCLISEV